MTNPFQNISGIMSVEKADMVHHATRVPGSKSLTNRFLLLAALANGRGILRAPLESDDTHYMRNALEQLGVEVSELKDGWSVAGSSNWKAPQSELFVGNAGTVMRFLAPALACHKSESVITGNERMLVRPIGDLVEGLRQLGASVTYAGEEGYPPLQIKGPMQPGRVTIKGDSSSQYLSGLLMALPLLPGDSEIVISGPLVSRTYVEMTLDCMAQMGVHVEPDPDFRVFSIKGDQRYRPSDLCMEPDASTASYWFALPLMVGGDVIVSDVPEKSHQGDFGLLDIFRQMGAGVSRSGSGVKITAAPLQGVDVDMNTMSDVAPTLAVVATRASSPTMIRNVYNMRIKECDRIATIQAAFDALGLKMESGRDWMKIYPGAPDKEALLNPEDDHRMAMIFALLGLAFGGVQIRDPQCVAKTYPTFYDDMAAAFKGQ